jgi:hypothetical protein
MLQNIEVAGQNSILAPKEAPVVQTRGLITADDYSLDEAYIITAKDNTNIKMMMVELSYYEDIFKGITSGSILINDSISLIDRLGMSGFDYLKLKFKKTIKSNEELTTEKYFRIYRVSERVLNNSATETYALHFCSEELLLSEQTKVSKSYSGKKISEIIYDILSDKLKIDKKFIRMQETDGLYDFVIPYKKPFEAINWLSNYAKPIGKKGADFLFYENAEGFNFYSLQNLFSQKPYIQFIYIPRSAGNKINGVGWEIKSAELGRNLIGIKSYVFLDTFDTLYGTISGAFANRLISIDPLTRTFKDTKFDYSAYFQNSKKLNENSLIPELKNRLGKKANENYDAVLKVTVSNSDQKKALGISEEPWNVANDVRVEDYVPNRTAQLSLSHYSRIKLSVSGDPNLTVGMLVGVSLPSSRSKNESGYDAGEEDPFHSGIYMITAVRHIIDFAGKYETILEVVKDSYSASVDNYDNSGDMQKAIKGDV